MYRPGSNPGLRGRNEDMLNKNSENVASKDDNWAGKYVFDLRR
jgi:hypothetical protein